MEQIIAQEDLFVANRIVEFAKKDQNTLKGGLFNSIGDIGKGLSTFTASQLLCAAQKLKRGMAAFVLTQIDEYEFPNPPVLLLSRIPSFYASYQFSDVKRQIKNEKGEIILYLNEADMHNLLYYGSGKTRSGHALVKVQNPLIIIPEFGGKPEEELFEQFSHLFKELYVKASRTHSVRYPAVLRILSEHGLYYLSLKQDPFYSANDIEWRYRLERMIQNADSKDFIQELKKDFGTRGGILSISLKKI